MDRERACLPGKCNYHKKYMLLLSMLSLNKLTAGVFLMIGCIYCRLLVKNFQEDPLNSRTYKEFPGAVDTTCVTVTGDSRQLHDCVLPCEDTELETTPTQTVLVAIRIVHKEVKAIFTVTSH